MRSRWVVVLLAIAVMIILCAAPVRPAAAGAPLPFTAISGADDLWHNQSVLLSFAATDTDGQGIAYTEYSLDAGATWVQGTSATIGAPSDHANDGVHTVLYRSVDNAGDAEEVKSVIVRIDTSAPIGKAFAASVIRGRTAKLRFAVTDPAPSCGIASLAIAIKHNGKIVRTITIASVATSGAAQSTSFRCRLACGRYSWTATATDLAGNRASQVTAVLVVTPADQRVERALSWALAHRGWHSWDNRCLTFVNNAYQSAGVAPQRWYLAIEAARALGASSHKGVPPRGAYVFYWSPCGHVGLSLGDGRIVHDFGYQGVIVSSYLGIHMTYIGWAPPKTTPQVSLGF